MRLPHRALRLALPIASLGLAFGFLAGAPSASAASNTGWIRYAHLSPNMPACDVYLYDFGKPDAEMVLKHVKYGGVSSYVAVGSGQYAVAMRTAGAAPTSPPVVSASVDVVAGAAYTIAAMGPASGLRLRVLMDQMSSPPGRALVRVIQASLQQRRVTVTDGTHVLARQLPFASVTSYQAVAAGKQKLRYVGEDSDAARSVNLAADTIHTLVVLDTPSGLAVNGLEDAAGSQTMPVGAADTGLGGTAPRAPESSTIPWMVSLAGGALLAAAGAMGLRRIRAGATRVS